jgi:hypothetical protein
MSERRSVASEIRRGDHLEMWDWSLESPVPVLWWFHLRVRGAPHTAAISAAMDSPSTVSRMTDRDSLV